MHYSRFGIREACALTLLVCAAPVAAQQEPSDDVLGDEQGADTPDEAKPDVRPQEAAEAAPEQGPAEAAPPEPVAEPVKAAPAPKDTSGGDMIVTGSRIKRSSFAQPSSVEVVDRKQLQLSGANNMADVVKYMNINTGSEFNADISGGSAGTAQFNLRGLGLNSTLVLLNGRRLVQSAALATDGSSFVDINTLPIQMVERIEVLKGGASAIYGSDAVAGVVNLITRKNYDGFEAQIGGQSTTHNFDQHEFDVSLIGGTHSEHSRVMAMLSYFKREPLLSTDRSFTNNLKNVSTIGQPGVYLPVGPNGAPVAKGIQDPACPAMFGSSTFPLSANNTDPTAKLPFCNFNFNSYYMLVLDEQRVNTYTTVEHDISDHTMVFFEGGFARSTTSRYLSPSFAILQPIFVPADSTVNPTGQRLRVYSRLLGGNSPPMNQDYQSDTLHTVAGISGDFGGLSDSKFGEWEWEVAGTYSTNRTALGLHDNLKGPLQDALNHCTPADDPANCLNPFATGQPNSQAILDKVTGELSVEGRTELTTAAADISGPIVKLPGGNLSLALGTQVRREVAKSNGDHDSNQLNYIFLSGGPDFIAQRHIFAGYGELSIPFFRGFDTQAAGRVENYSDVGTSFDPMFGLSWTPATTFMGDEASAPSKARVRGTYANSFVAPSLLQGYGAQTALLSIFNNGFDPAMPNKPVAATSGVFVPVTTVGNPNLNPQTSTAVTGGVEWAPVKGMLLSTDYWHYDYKKIIVKEDPQQVVDADFRAASAANPLGNPAVQRDPGTRTIQGVTTKFINASSVVTQGIDLDFNYHTDFGAQAGVFGFGLNGSYVLSYDIPYDQFSLVSRDFPDAHCSAASNTCNVAGLRNITNFARPIPRLRVTLPLSWTMSGHTAAVIGHFIGGYNDDGPQVPPVMSFPAIDAFVSFDIQYGYRIDEGHGQGTTFKVGVLNIANAYPPYVAAPLGYDTLVHDPRGRMIYGRIIQEL